MVTISAKGRVRSDGSLNLSVNTGLPETDVEVVLVVEPVAKAVWPEGYFERTFGSLRDDPIRIEPPPGFEVRKELG